MKGGHVHNNTHFTGKKRIKNLKRKKKIKVKRVHKNKYPLG